MNAHTVGVGTVAVIALLTFVAGALAGTLLASRHTYGRHSRQHGERAVSEMRARARHRRRDDDVEPATQPLPVEPPTRPATERVRVMLSDDDAAATDEVPLWPVTDTDTHPEPAPIILGGYTF